MRAPVDQSEARPLFRRLAAVVGIVCLILAVVFALASTGGDTRLTVYACAAVGVIMVGIALNGRWPWWGRH